MINGVLIEKTVKDVTPALETNSEGLKKVLEELVKQYKRQQEDMEKWKVSSYHFRFYHHNYDGYAILVSSLDYGRTLYLPFRHLLMNVHVTQKKNNIQVVQQ